jgi:hypothetical protein
LSALTSASACQHNRYPGVNEPVANGGIDLKSELPISWQLL